MRWLVCASMACASSSVLAQGVVPGLLQHGIDRLIKTAPPGSLPQKNPLEPQGYPSLPPKALPAPDSSVGLEQDDRIHVIRMPFFNRQGNLTRAWGGVRVQYKGWDIFANEMLMNLDTNVFEASGDVSIYGQDAVVRGFRVVIDFNNNSYIAYDAESQIAPTLLKGEFQDALYVKAKESHGTEQELFGTDADVTTCNLQIPHFHIEAEKTTIRPGVRAIFRRVRLNILGTTVLRLPYLSIPLNEPTYRYLPEFGRNEQDGYYVKARYGIPLKDINDGLDARLDYFEKRGMALGGDYNYVNKAATGLLTLYALTGLNKTFNANNTHEQRFPWGTISLDNSYQKNNFLTAPESTLVSNRVQVNLPQRSGNSRLGYVRSENSSASFSSLLQTLSLNDTRNFGPRTNSRMDVSWTQNESGTIQREQVDVRADAQHDFKEATAKFEYQRSIPVGDVQNFFSSNDRTPVLSLASDAKRLFGKRIPFGIPFTTEVSAGEYIDSLSREHITRSAFDLRFDKQQDRTNEDRMKIGFNGRFQQGMYSDDTAQYILALNSQLTYRLGAKESFNVRYSYLRPYGFTPLQIDRSGKTNVLTMDASYRPIPQLLLGLQSGYDILAIEQARETPWQTVGFRTEYDPASWLRFRTLSTYDPLRKVWNSSRVDITYKPGATLVTIGARYDGIRQLWGDLNVLVEGFTWGRLKSNALVNYNGYTREIQSQQFSFIYDLHCAEAVVDVIDNRVGFRPGQQINIFIRLKAFPSLSNFGLGNFGQPIGTGTGRRF